MTLKNNITLFKLFASFRSHLWIQVQSGNARFGSKSVISVPCYLGIRCIALKNNWAPLLCYFKLHSGETDEANCSWLHPVWPPPKRPDQDSTFYVVSRASTDLIFCIHWDFDVRKNVYKPRRLWVLPRYQRVKIASDEANCTWEWSQLLGRICVRWSQLSMDEANSTFATTFKA